MSRDISVLTVLRRQLVQGWLPALHTAAVIALAATTAVCILPRCSVLAQFLRAAIFIYCKAYSRLFNG